MANFEDYQPITLDDILGRKKEDEESNLLNSILSSQNQQVNNEEVIQDLPPRTSGMAESLPIRSGSFLPQETITPTPAPEQMDTGPSPASVQQLPSEPSIKQKQQVFDFGKGGLGTVQNLQNVQKEAKDIRDDAQLGRLGEIIGTGIGGLFDRGTITKPVLGDYLSSQEKEADRKVPDYLNQVEMEKNDPGSPISKGYRDLMKRMGVTIKGDASAASLEKLFPVLEKMQAAEMNAEAKKLQGAQAAYWKQAAHNLKSDKQKDTNESKASNQLATLKNRMVSGGGLVGNQIRQGIVGAERIFNTVGIDPNITLDQVSKMPVEKLDTVTKLGIVESAIELNRLLSGSGVPAQKTLQKLIPQNILMGTTTVKDYLTSELNPAQQGQFIRELLKVTARVRDSAKEHNNEMMKKYLSGSTFIKEHDPGGYQNMLEEFKLSDPLDKKKEEPMVSKMGLDPLPTKSNSPSNKMVVKKGYNPKTNQTQLIYSDGTKEIKDGRL